MSRLIVLCFAVTLTLVNCVSPPHPDSDREIEERELESAYEKCQGTRLTHIDDETHEKLFKHEYIDPHLIEFHTLCEMVELDIMDRSGNVNIEVLKTHLARIIKDEHALEQQIHKCNVHGSSALENSMHLFFCIHDAVMVHHELYSMARAPLFGDQVLSGPVFTNASEPNPNPPIANETAPVPANTTQ